MLSLEEPLSETELKELHELLNSGKLFERMVERAVKDRRKTEQRRKRTTTAS